MIGIEIVRDQKTKEKAADLRNHIVDRAFYHGLCILGAGENTLRLSPPLMIDQQQADAALAIVEKCLHEAESQGLRNPRGFPAIPWRPAVIAAATGFSFLFN